MGLLSFFRKAVSKLLKKSVVENALGIEVAVSSKMREAILNWAEMYEDRPYWKNEAKGKLTMNLPASIASEVALMVTVEMKSEVSGSPRADFLNLQYQPVVKQARQFTEFACAKGGVVLKPYVAGNRIYTSVIQAEDFYPTAFDSDGDVTGGVFVDYRYVGKYKYTRFEHHDLNGTTYTIKNKVFRTVVIEVTNDDDSVLGDEVSLTEVADWAGIAPEVVINDVEKTIFSYFKMPMANQVEPRSPLGVSVYSRAVDQIKQADKVWSETMWEYEAKEAAIFLPASLLTRDKWGVPILPEGKERLYRAYEFNRGEEKIDPYTPDIRDASMFTGVNRCVQRVEFLCGLAYGTISDPQVVEKTATEVKNAKIRSFSNISDTQKALQKALEHLLYAMDVLATLYEMSPEGEYEASFEFDDSIVTDGDTEFSRLMSMASANMIKPEKVPAWYFGISEEEARKMMPGVEEEDPGNENPEEDEE